MREVYSALVDEIFIVEKNRTGPVPIRDYTSVPNFVLEWSECGIGAVKADTWNDFKAKNSDKSRLEGPFNLSTNCSLVNENDNPQALEIVGLSRVGFDPERTLALVHADDIAVWGISTGYLVLLKNEDGAWNVEQMTVTYFGE